MIKPKFETCSIKAHLVNSMSSSFIPKAELGLRVMKISMHICYTYSLCVSMYLYINELNKLEPIVHNKQSSLSTIGESYKRFELEPTRTRKISHKLSSS